jgi:hypothetical protein
VLRAREPASLKICALLGKHGRREVEVPLDYAGFHIPNEFMFGNSPTATPNWSADSPPSSRVGGPAGRTMH